MEGTWIKQYRIVSLLGEGGMGRVYLAEDTKLRRKVSLKFLSTRFTQDQSGLRRFEREARAVSALNHPNILTIYEIGEENGRQFIATEFVEGQTLRERLHSPIDVEDALEIAVQVASALVAAHRVKIIHRDIKPENIMIRTDDRLVKLLDFGLAKTSEGTAAEDASNVDTEVPTRFKTAPGMIMGTVAYMSPEQARGAVVDERTDIWSLGVVLYEMIAGRPPFNGASSNEIISAILSREPAPPLARSSQLVPDRLEEIVEKALAKNWDERYQTCKDLLIDLKRVKQSLERGSGTERDASPSSAQSASAPKIGRTSDAEYLLNQVGSHKRGLIAGATVLLLLVAGGPFYAWRLRQPSGKAAINAIAVLPFTNTNSDADTEFLSDGISDNIIDRLSHLPDLRVTSHTAAFHYKGRETDPRTIGKELGVEAVLTGRVAIRGEQLTIRLELVDAKDSRHLWGEQYDRKLSDLLAVQREIPLDVSNKLQLRLSGQSKERLTRGETANPEAYQLYLRGRYFWNRRTEEATRKSISYFERAAAADPNYALAYSGLADAYWILHSLDQAGEAEHLPSLAKAAALKAIALDDTLAEAHTSLGEINQTFELDFRGAERDADGIEIPRPPELFHSPPVGIKPISFKNALRNFVPAA